MPTATGDFLRHRAPKRRGALFRTATHDEPQVMKRKKALLIGVEYQPLAGTPDSDASTSSGSSSSSIGRLNTPHEDVSKMRGLLIRRYGYRKEDITIMMDRDGIPEELQPTRENIINGIKRLVGDARRGDHFFFHFAGHSTQDKCQDPMEEEDGQDEYICTADDEVIKDNELKELLVDPLPYGTKLTALFDCCHSATILDLPHTHCHESLQSPSPGIPTFASFSSTSTSTSTHYTSDLAPRSASLFSRRAPTSLDLSTPLPTLRPNRGPGSPSKAAMTGLGLKTDFRVESSPLKECMSPVSVFRCDGSCKKRDPKAVYRGPNVICLSAAKDNQYSWESKTSSMTQSLIAILDTDTPRPVLHTLLTGLSNEVHDFCVKIRKRGMRRWMRKHPNEAYPYQIKDFQQDPQISSLETLNMKAIRWDP